MCTYSLLRPVQRADHGQVQLNSTTRCFFSRSGRAGDFLADRRLPGASDRHLPDTNEVVTVSSEEGLAISAPCEGQALRGISPGTSGHLGSELLDMFLLSRSQILMVGPVAAHSQYLL